jgi:cob(I)alamin adenosyltransferase
MKIYTKTGDSGSTSLANGRRVKKNDLRVEVYGCVDELNTIIGIVLTEELDLTLKEPLEKISNLLFNLGSDIASPVSEKQVFEINRISENEIIFLEKLIDDYTEKLPPLKNFILPGGTKAAAFLHQARTVCRRAERLAITLSEKEDLGEYIIKYLNRLSDFLFTAARFANFLAGIEDRKWEK